MTRVRQSEWRRRWGVSALASFDGQVGAGGDDGFSRDVGGGYDNSAAFYRIGKDAASGVVDGFARFTNVTIPAGATIDVAYIIVQRNNADGKNDGAACLSNIYFSDEDNPAAPTTQAEHAADPRTTAFTAWDEASLLEDADNNSPSIVDVIQEIVDRGGWNSGQAMMCLWDDDGSNLTKRYSPWSYDGDSARAMKLHVEYSA